MWLLCIPRIPINYAHKKITWSYVQSVCVWCVCVCVCMCQVHKRYNEGSLERARLASRQAKHWSAVAIVTGSIVWTVLAVTISVVLVLKFLAS